ncbi:MAG: Spo0E family sporulation regulatory protein-aspartic acid phosphatase [Blautia sp.]|nr:Spo0E family sporulation regulatory protein-aspartic acid phosphatase [Blautia sp.]
MCVNRVEDLKARIEKERSRLNQLVRDMQIDETYQQSLLVDELVAEYISLTNE